MTSYLITGGLGSLGSALVTHLYKNTQSSITVLDNLSGHSDISQIDTIIDCATRARSAIDRSPVAGARNALQGLTHVLDAVRDYGHLKSYLLISCQSVSARVDAENQFRSKFDSFRSTVQHHASSRHHWHQ
ncbi:hypothetical protein ANCDUO_04894 [Ancylostoma duodenale]|uniref:Uncharacterized protein n=1 Tax=Ancylostoma duodenale TaxID=51022 RepID=A0A0C2D5F0_9BILA|nr:hypothetical protein ANCDUO_04894 [Ancylostoma duodenale]